MSKTTEDRVSDNETAIAVLTQSCGDCKKVMNGGLERVEKNQERSDKRFDKWLSAILVTLLLILGGVVATLIKVAVAVR